MRISTVLRAGGAKEMDINISNCVPELNKTPVENTADAPEFPSEFLTPENPVEIFEAPEILPTHPAEPDLFARHEGIPAHEQTIVGQVRAVLIGGGGFNRSEGQP